MVHQKSGQWILGAIGGSPKEGRYSFKVLDRSSGTGLVLDGGERGEEVGKFICREISTEAIPWSFSADLRQIKIEKSEVMKEMQKSRNEGTYFVLPCQLNGVDSPSPDRILTCLEECKSDEELFQRRGVRGSLAVHPALAQFLLDNGAGSCGLSAIGKVLDSISSDNVAFRNGYLKIGGRNYSESLRALVANLHKMQPLVVEEVPATGLQRSKNFTTAIHCVHLAFASAVPVDPQQRNEEFYQELSKALLVAQYFGAMKRAVEKAELKGKQKIYLVPPGDWGDRGDNYFSFLALSISEAVGLLKTEDFQKLDVRVLLEDADEQKKLSAEIRNKELYDTS